MRPQTLNILEINVISIISNEKRASLTELLKRHKPDVGLLCETKLNNKHKIHQKWPNAVQCGSTGILIKNNIKFKNSSRPFSKSNIRNNYLEIKTVQPNNNNLFLIAAYATNSGKNEFTAEMNKIFKILETRKNKYYFLPARDLNANHSAWNNSTDNNRGVALYKWIQTITYRLTLLHTEVRSYPKGESFLDICITDNRFHFHGLTAQKKLKSFKYDHRTVSIKISLKANEHFEIDENIPT